MLTPRTRLVVTLVPLVLGLVATRPALGQCNVWSPVGSGANQQTSSYTTYGGDLVIGGYFTTIDGVSAQSCARWDGASWHPLGAGLGWTAYDWAEYGGDLVAVGRFTTAGGAPAPYVARWNGSSWFALGSGLDNQAVCATVHDGALVVGGVFSQAGGQPASYIAQWNGSTWQPLGSGMNSIVTDLVAYDGDLIAAGSFTTAGGQSAVAIARWDGAAWHPMGDGFDARVNQVVVYDGTLIAAGRFTSSGAQPLGHVARWDGAAWRPLGTLNDDVFRLLVVGDDLYAAGDFTVAGTAAAMNTARWDGAFWHALEGEIDGTVEALGWHDGSLYIGGFLQTVDGQAVNHVARWTPVPVIGTGPDDTTVAEGATAMMSVAPADTGSGPFTYRWRKAGVPLDDGGSISGARTDTLVITGAMAADVGAYDVVVTNACGAQQSAPAALSLDGAGTCPADRDGDGAVGFQDLLKMLTEWGPCP
jgi:hypothetical protein